MRIGKKTLFGLLAAGMSLITANACIVQVRVACADDESLQGVRVWMQGPGDAFTDEFGIATFSVDTFGTYNLCVDTTTLPAGAKVSPACVKIKVLDDAPPVFNFVVTGPFCAPPAPGLCWMTGGGQIGKGGTGVGNFSFGGVVYPGLQP